jgi:hypothetical protein
MLYPHLAKEGIMARVIGIHRLELKPGATDEQAQALAERAAREFKVPGAKNLIGKGDRGERAGQYVMIVEIDSVETRDRYFPDPLGEPSAEWQQLTAAYGPIFEQFAAVFTNFPDPLFTDYVIVGE